MPASRWRERREAYLRERGRLGDLIREGYVETAFQVIPGRGRGVPGHCSPLMLLPRPQQANDGFPPPAESNAE